MWEFFSKILGRHTASLLDKIADGGPFCVQLCERPRERPLSQLAVDIDFDGVLTEGLKKVNGYVICGAASYADVRPLLTDIADHLGLEASILETESGPQNILKEFLNIVIGLTGAEWAENGFDIDFSTPDIISGRVLPPIGSGDHSFHLVASSPAGIRVDILVVFNEHGKPENQVL